MALLAVAFVLPLLFGLGVALLSGWEDGAELWLSALSFLLAFGVLFAVGFSAIRAMRRRLLASEPGSTPTPGSTALLASPTASTLPPFTLALPGAGERPIVSWTLL